MTVRSSLAIAGALAVCSISGSTAVAGAAGACLARGIALQTTSQGGAASRLVSYGADHDGHSTRTEYLPDGSYIVTACNPDGTFKEQQRDARVATPDGGWAYLPLTQVKPSRRGFSILSATYPDPTDKRAAEAWPHGEQRLLERVIPPSDPGRLAQAPPSMRSGNGGASTMSACSDFHFENLVRSGWPVRWYPTNFFTIHRSGIDSGWDTLVTGGLESWRVILNDCGLSVTARIGYQMVGTATHEFSRNGTSTVQADTGIARSVCTGAIACTQVYCEVVGAACQANESDIVFNHGDFCMTGGAAPSCYDLWSISAHEFGHFLGLDHVSNPGDEVLVMWPFGTLNSTKRRLGLGDLNGLQTLYPTPL